MPRLEKYKLGEYLLGGGDGGGLKTGDVIPIDRMSPMAIPYSRRTTGYSSTPVRPSYDGIWIDNSRNRFGTVLSGSYFLYRSDTGALVSNGGTPVSVVTSNYDHVAGYLFLSQGNEMPIRVNVETGLVVPWTYTNHPALSNGGNPKQIIGAGDGGFFIFKEFSRWFRFGPDGSLVSENLYSAMTAFSYFSRATRLPDGNFILVGANSTSSSATIVTRKVSPLGAQLDGAILMISNSYNNILGVESDDAGNFYIHYYATDSPPNKYYIQRFRSTAGLTALYTYPSTVQEDRSMAVSRDGQVLVCFIGIAYGTTVRVFYHRKYAANYEKLWQTPVILAGSGSYPGNVRFDLSEPRGSYADFLTTGSEVDQAVAIMAQALTVVPEKI